MTAQTKPMNDGLDHLMGVTQLDGKCVAGVMAEAYAPDGQHHGSLYSPDPRDDGLAMHVACRALHEYITGGFAEREGSRFSQFLDTRLRRIDVKVSDTVGRQLDDAEQRAGTLTMSKATDGSY